MFGNLGSREHCFSWAEENERWIRDGFEWAGVCWQVRAERYRGV